MNKRFTELSFIIGLFFSIVALILWIGYFISDALSSALNIYAGILFLVFGLFMIFIPHKKQN